jgi:antitoxin component YwqK of YwqJK toxin-antitoxin module
MINKNLILFLIIIISCERFYIPPKPTNIKYKAQYNHRLRQWNYDDGKNEFIWFEDGKLFRYAEKSGNLYHGKFIQYFRNGNVSQEGVYDSGYRVGKWTYYFPNGGVYLIINYNKYPADKERFSLNSSFGNENGPYVRYYDNGQIEEKGFYYAGRFHHTRIHYYKNGKKQFEILYNQGKKNGIAKYYDDQERLIREEFYQNDILTKMIHYNHKENHQYST